MHDCGVWNGKRPHPAPVDHYVIRRDLQPIQGAVHGQHTGLVDVDAVDLAHGRCAKRKSYRTLADLSGKADALIVGQALRVVNSRDRPSVGRHDDRTRQHRTGDRAATYFIYSGEERSLVTPQIPLDGRPPFAPRHHAATRLRGRALFGIG
jgi:hypothetical protein